jgi:hypothetical protein
LNEHADVIGRGSTALRSSATCRPERACAGWVAMCENS